MDVATREVDLSRTTDAQSSTRQEIS